MTKKITISIVLLIIATGFWLWSQDVLKKGMMERQGRMENTAMKDASTGTPISDVEMDSEINAALMLDSELELKGIDGEF
jgi:hypothetical protein